jgi:hypothetical protein
VNHAVAYPNQSVGAEMTLRPPDHRLQKWLEGLVRIRPALFRQDCASRSARDEVRRGTNPRDLACGNKL